MSDNIMLITIGIILCAALVAIGAYDPEIEIAIGDKWYHIREVILYYDSNKVFNKKFERKSVTLYKYGRRGE